MDETDPLVDSRPSKSLRTGSRGRTSRRRSLRTLYIGASLLIVLLGVLLYGPNDDCEFDVLLPPEAERTALLLTAHPDDEAMFFSPTILSMISHGWDLSGLCLSVGNGSGLGAIRREELFSSYELLGIPPDRVAVLDHPLLQDGMQHIWDPRDIAPLVEDHLRRQPASLIITFDPTGITRHPNHMPLHSALDHLSITPPPILLLKSPSIISKFTGPAYAIYYIVSSHIRTMFPWSFSPKGSEVIVVVSSLGQWIQGWKAMLEHRSQLVWFRWLYLLFSRLMWVNELIVLQ